MKEHITPKQAKQVTEEQYYSLFTEIVPRDDWANFHHKKMTVGKMLGLVAGNGIEIKNDAKNNKWVVKDSHKTYEAEHLVDVLWQTVKEKINKK